MAEDLGDEGMAEGVKTIVHHNFTKNKKASSSNVRTIVPSA